MQSSRWAGSLRRRRGNSSGPLHTPEGTEENAFEFSGDWQEVIATCLSRGLPTRHRRLSPNGLSDAVGSRRWHKEAHPPMVQNGVAGTRRQVYAGLASETGDPVRLSYRSGLLHLCNLRNERGGPAHGKPDRSTSR
jgi:hypothetical protein